MVRTKTTVKRQRREEETARRNAEIVEKLSGIRERLTKIQLPWVKGNEFDLVQMQPTDSSQFTCISVYSSHLLDSYSTRVMCIVKGIALQELVNFSDFNDAYNLCIGYGLDKFWHDLEFDVGVDEVRQFYANLFGKFGYRKYPTELKSFVNEQPIHWTIREVNEWLGFENVGFKNFLTNPWVKEVVGVSLEEVKGFVGKDLLTMSMRNRILLALVTYCVCGKSAKLPSNLDYLLVYLMLKGQPINFGALFLHLMVEAMYIKNKGLSIVNLVTFLLKKSGVEIDEVSRKEMFDFVGKTNIEMMFTSRRRKGKTPVVEEEEEEEEVRAEGERFEEERVQQEVPPPPRPQVEEEEEESDDEIYERMDELEEDMQRKYDIMVEENSMRIAEIEALQAKLEGQKQKMAKMKTKMKTKMSRMKSYLANLFPQSCLPSSSSSDSD